MKNTKKVEAWKQARKKIKEAIDILETNYENTFIIYDTTEGLKNIVNHLNNLED